MEKVRVHLNTTCLLVLIYVSTKYLQSISNHILKEFGLEIHSGEVTRKQPQQRLSLLHVTHLLVVTNASTKHYQNMSKSIKVMERTRFWLQGNNYITKKKVRVVSLARDTPTVLPSFLPNIIILSQTVWKLWSAQDFGFRGDHYITKKVRVISLAHDRPTGPLPFYKILSKYV